AFVDGGIIGDEEEKRPILVGTERLILTDFALGIELQWHADFLQRFGEGHRHRLAHFEPHDHGLVRPDRPHRGAERPEQEKQQHAHQQRTGHSASLRAVSPSRPLATWSNRSPYPEHWRETPPRRARLQRVDPASPHSLARRYASRRVRQ